MASSFAPLVARSGTASPPVAARAAGKEKEARKPAVRPKLKVSDPSEPMEREADRAADRVMRQGTPSFPMAGSQRDDKRVHRAAKKDDKAKRETNKDDKAKRAAKKDDKARRAPKKDDKAKRETKKDDKAKRETKKDDKAKRDAATGPVPGDAGGAPTGFEAALARARQSSGDVLASPTRHQMESGFGQSFGGVRMHSDGQAAALSDSIDARAFTIGNDVFFGAGQYQPHTPGGRRLIAHELAHVTQQNDGRVAQPSLWREANTTAQTGQPTTTGPQGSAKPKDDQAPPAAPQNPPRFDVQGPPAKAIIKEPVAGKVGTFELPEIKVPEIRGGKKGAVNNTVPQLVGKPGPGMNQLIDQQPFEYLGPTPRGSTTARQSWIKAASGDSTLQSTLKAAIESKFGGGAAPQAAAGATPANAAAPLAQGNQKLYYLRPDRGGEAPFFIVGTAEQAARHEFMVMPIWNKQKGIPKNGYDVDHLMELQIGGFDGWDNFWILDASSNRSSGSKIHKELVKDVDTLIGEAKKGDANGNFWVSARGGNAPTADDVLKTWKIRYASVGKLDIAGNKDDHWTKKEIQDGMQLDGLRAMGEQEIAKAGLVFTPGTKPTFINVFTNPQGGFFKRLDRKADKWVPEKVDFFRGFDQIEIDIAEFESVQEARSVGSISGRAFHKASKDGQLFEAPNIKLPLVQAPNLGFGLYVDKAPLNKALSALYMKKASPVQIDDAGLSANGTLFVSGRIIASVSLFEGVEIPFSIEGDTFTLSFPIPTDKLKLGPVEVTDASLDIGVGPDGLVLGGGVGFAVKKVGRGRVQAVAGTAGVPQPPAAAKAAGSDKAAGGDATAAAPSGAAEEPGFALAGTFDFETDKLDPASISVGYANHQFVADATVGLRKGTVRGVESSQIHVASAPEGITIDGFVVLGIPPLQGTRLTVRRDAQGAIEIVGENIPLPVGDIPGVRGATATVRVAQNADTGEWVVSGGGTADIGVAGFAGQLAVDVNGPFVTVSGRNLTLQRGPLKGAGNFQVTNKPLDPTGNPVEGGEPGPMTASGRVEASMPLGSYLTATLGGTFLPNGELTFSGGVSLPPTVDLFERREYKNVLFRPPSLDIPIFGITAAGQRIGIFATIGGSLSFVAGIGPGQLRNAALTAEFNPDHPENTTVAGHAQFYVPANAGLRLEIHGGIGAGIPIVSAEAGIEVGGELGVKAEASADVDVAWTPQAGLDVKALAHIGAQPQFTFDISAYLSIKADVVITEFTLYSEHWKLAAFSFGPQVAVGADLPIHWSERGGLDFDLNKIELRRPDIDFKQLGNDLINHLVG